jgi:signal transduction histidine kinase
METPTNLELDVLVVDGQSESRAALCGLVRAAGHEARSATSGDEAVQLMLHKLPDVVLLDLSMQGFDGFAASARIRLTVGRRWVPVVALSSQQGDRHIIEALEHGADDCMSLPINSALLKAKLHHFGRVLSMQSRIGALAQRQRDIHDNIPDPVVTVNERGQIVGANLAACRTFADGRAHTLMGRDVEAVTGAVLPPPQGRGPVTLRYANGEQAQVEVAASEWHEGGRQRITMVLRDVTEQRRVERMRDEFLATVSHELRTPLTSVLGAVSLLASGAAGQLPAAALPLAEAAQRNGARLSKLIDDILDVTKLEGDRMAMNLRAQPLLPLVEEALLANRSYAEMNQVRLRIQADPAIAATGAAPVHSPEVCVDADRFMQVMANLLSNAIKYSPKGAEVTVALSGTAGTQQVTISDRGPGISQGFYERLFEKFSQAEGGDRRARGGTGLGLYITRLLVERMGGLITLQAGPGASFRVEFPLSGVVPLPSLPPVVHIEFDADVRARVADWLSSRCQVHSFGLAQAVPAQLRGVGPVIANPQGQGSADAFGAALRLVATRQPVLLFSDSVDASYAASQGFRWLSCAATNQTQLNEAVRAMMFSRGTWPQPMARSA